MCGAVAEGPTKGQTDLDQAVTQLSYPKGEQGGHLWAGGQRAGSLENNGKASLEWKGWPSAPDFFVSRVVALGEPIQSHTRARVCLGPQNSASTPKYLSGQTHPGPGRCHREQLRQARPSQNTPVDTEGPMRRGAGWSNWSPGEGPNPHLQQWALRGDAAYPPPGGRSPPSSHHLAACTSLVRRQMTVMGGIVALGRNTSPHASPPHPAPTSGRHHTYLTRSPREPWPPQLALEQPL